MTEAPSTLFEAFVFEKEPEIVDGFVGEVGVLKDFVNRRNSVYFTMRKPVYYFHALVVTIVFADETSNCFRASSVVRRRQQFHSVQIVRQELHRFHIRHITDD